MKSRVIFASLILGLGLMISESSAATTIFDDSPASAKPANALLVNGSEKLFALFVEQKLNNFTKKSSWQNFMSVVSLYNQNPVAVLSLDEASRKKFNEANVQLSNELAKSNGNLEVTRWANQANQTARMINLLWNVEAEASKTPDAE
ncbi:hypothetical protein [Rudanella lutea]|uniref:hypothetical protein n=1 Tax=Rudanella lutea TaxID=451374 RepID=UPI00037C3125|nr:hypothetical protein [Rudanella lutea]